MRLHRLNLRNFKGIRDFTFEPGGRDTRIFGDNATGKSTLADAFHWLLFGKDSRGQAQFSIKTLGPDGDPIHKLEHEVEGVLELQGGKKITLKKIYKERWVKRRGAAEREFDGHTTDHFIDDVPMTKTEYTMRVNMLADEDLFRMLTDPRHFSGRLHWQERRDMLLRACGDVSDQDVIDAHDELASLADVLGERSIEEHRKVVKSRQTKINKELGRIPVRVDEVRRGMPDTKDLDEKALRKLLADLRKSRDKKQAERSRIASGGEVAEKRRELAEVETEISDLERTLMSGIDERIQGERKKLSGLDDEISDVERTVRSLRSMNEEDQEVAERMVERMERLRTEWLEVDASTFEAPDVDDTCPTCGQSLPEEQVEETVAEARAQFQQHKARKLEEIAAGGKKQRESHEQALGEIEQRAEQADEAESTLEGLGKKRAEITDLIDNLRDAKPDPESSPEMKALLEEKAYLSDAIETLREKRLDALVHIDGQIADLDAEVANTESAISKLEQRQKAEKRIEELEAEQKALAGEYEEMERQLYLCDEFTRRKVSMLEKQINSEFGLAEFKLFRVLVNGGLEECCETTFEGVPWSDLNNGARINVGLDIIDTLSRHHGFRAPIWIDNAEAVTHITSTQAQQIHLVVSESDEALRVETLKEVA